jgi:DNA-binding CsgD family transcriptional regulator
MRPIARLHVRSGGEGLLLLKPGQFVIGRHSDCDLILDCPGVSRNHVVLHVTESSVRLVDQGSRNGTRVNGQLVNECGLDNDCLVQFGPATCSFQLIGPRASSNDYPTPASDFEHEAEGLLTPAEHRVLLLLLGGHSEKETAVRLASSRHTVHNHVKKIYSSFGVNSRSELLALFISPGVRSLASKHAEDSLAHQHVEQPREITPSDSDLTIH